MPAPTPRFRSAQLADVERVVQLVESAYRGESSRLGWTTEAELLDGQRTDRDEVTELTQAHGARLLLAELAGEIVGCVLVRSEPETRAAHIGLFAVRPTLQSRGLGSALLTHAEQVAQRELGARRAEMTVIEQRDDILAWYERRGYRRTGATEPFPYGNPRAGLPRRPDLRFLVLAKELPA